MCTAVAYTSLGKQSCFYTCIYHIMYTARDPSWFSKLHSKQNLGHGWSTLVKWVLRITCLKYILGNRSLWNQKGSWAGIWHYEPSHATPGLKDLYCCHTKRIMVWLAPAQSSLILVTLTKHIMWRIWCQPSLLLVRQQQRSLRPGLAWRESYDNTVCSILSTVW